MPFRLTRNLQTFFTPFGVDGIFITSMALAAQVCSFYLKLSSMFIYIQSDMASNTVILLWPILKMGIPGLAFKWQPAHSITYAMDEYTFGQSDDLH